MSEQKIKFNPYTIIIIILLLVVAILLYNQWGDGIFSKNNNNGDTNNSNQASVVSVDITEDDIQIGSNDAPVSIVEYFSYFCGYCKLFYDETYQEILSDYITTGKVRIILRPFPPFEVSVAVLCAEEQDKFFDYHEALFENSNTIQAVEDLKTLAKNIGLDETKFNQCLDSQKYIEKAQNWYNQGQTDFEKAGVPEAQRGTPAFFINGEALIGAQPYDAFIEIIEKKLSE